MRRTLSVLTLLAVLVSLLVAGVAAQMEAAVDVSDQDSDGATVVIDSVVSEGDGFIVIHRDNDGSPGEVIGHAPVSDGENTDVEVTLDGDVEDGETLWAMLHTDDNTMGTYEFGDVEGADAPVTDADGDIVMQSFTVSTSAMTTAEGESSDTAEGESSATAEGEAPSTMPETGGDAALPVLPLIAFVAGLLLLAGAVVLRPRTQ